MTAQTTVKPAAAAPKAPVVPGREEVLKAFAREAMGEPETAAPPATAEAENAADALSQSGQEVTENAEAATETPEEKAAREAAEAAEPEDTENHLEDDLREALPEEVQQAVNRRIGKEVAKTKTEREQREAAEAKVTELEQQIATAPQTSRPANLGPLGAVHSLADLGVKKGEAEEAVIQAEDLLTQLEDDPAGVEQVLRATKIENWPKDENGEPDYSSAQMRKFLRTARTNADRQLRLDIPKREEFLKKADVAANQAVELMPELKEATSPRRKLFGQVLREHPEIQRYDNWPLRVVAGVKAMEWMHEQVAAKTAKTAPAKPRREVPVQIPAPRAQPARTTANAPKAEDANAVADKVLSGDKSARLDVIKGFVPKMR